MSTKENLSDQLNGVLGVDVEWSKMSREDLETLVKLFGDPLGIVQLGVKMLKTKTQEDIMGRKLGDILQSSTLLNLRDRGRGGPLGLGILPSFLGKEKVKAEEKVGKVEEKKEAETLKPEPTAEEHKDEEKA